MSGLAPKLRFKQDDGSDFPEWEEKPFGQAVTRGTQDKERPNRPNLWVIDLEHLESGTGRILSKSTTENSLSQKNVFSSGDILFGKLRPYLKKYARPDFDGVCSSEIWVLSGIEVINAYLFYVVQTSYFNQLANISSGSKMPRSDWETIADSEFSIPSLPEQQKIADFLSSVDAKIDAVKRKLDAYERYKKGLMQQIFSQKLRFKQDDGSDFPEWEEKRLGEIGSVYGGLTGKSADDFGSGVPFVTYMQIFKNSFVKMSECAFVKINDGEKQNRVAYGDVLITTSSETPQEVGYTSVLLEQPNELYLNSFSFGFRANDDQLLPELSRYLFRSSEYRIKVMLLAQGSTRYNISKSGFLKISLNIPSLPEQQKIADFLSSMDAKIDAIKAHIDKLEAFKKGLLQQMFV